MGRRDRWDEPESWDDEEDEEEETPWWFSDDEDDDEDDEGDEDCEGIAVEDAIAFNALVHFHTQEGDDDLDEAKRLVFAAIAQDALASKERRLAREAAEREVAEQERIAEEERLAQEEAERQERARQEADARRMRVAQEQARRQLRAERRPSRSTIQEDASGTRDPVAAQHLPVPNRRDRARDCQLARSAPEPRPTARAGSNHRRPIAHKHRGQTEQRPPKSAVTNHRGEDELRVRAHRQRMMQAAAFARAKVAREDAEREREREQKRQRRHSDRSRARATARAELEAPPLSRPVRSAGRPTERRHSEATSPARTNKDAPAAILPHTEVAEPATPRARGQSKAAPPERQEHPNETLSPLTGTDLAAWRARHGLNQQAAAKRLGVGQGTISKAERKADKPLGPSVSQALTAVMASEPRQRGRG